MSKPKKSGPAIFMYCVIGITLITSIICFYLYYGNIHKTELVLWIGIIAFTIIFDSQFIIIQRYNRPRVLKILEREEIYRIKNIL